MTAPVFTYSTVNGKRVVSISGSAKLETKNTTAPSGTHDVKTTNGNAVIRLGNDLYEPLDIATALNKV
jgi:hypothetical protein